MKIESKEQARKLYRAGAFGNRFRLWTPTEFFALKSHPFPVGLMYDGQPGMGNKLPYYCEPLFGVTHVQTVIQMWEALGAEIGKIIVSEHSLSSGEETFQCEVRRSETFYDVTWTPVAAPMPVAFRMRTNFAEGLEAKCLLEHYLDLPSYENLQRLFDTYPDAVVELTTLDRPVGIYGWNTVFWEVRNY